VMRVGDQSIGRLINRRQRPKPKTGGGSWVLEKGGGQLGILDGSHNNNNNNNKFYYEM
jgi:hypothetical protein